MTFHKKLKSAGLQTAVIGCALTFASVTVAADAKLYSLGDSGELVTNYNSDVDFNENNGEYLVNLGNGGLCFSVKQSTPLTLTAGGKVVDLDSFGVDQNQMVTGMISVDEGGIYAGSTTTCQGISSVTTQGGGIFGLGPDGTVLLVAAVGFGLPLIFDDSNDSPPAVMPEPPAPDVPPTPVADVGGGGGGGGRPPRRPRPPAVVPPVPPVVPPPPPVVPPVPPVVPPPASPV